MTVLYAHSLRVSIQYVSFFNIFYSHYVIMLTGERKEKNMKEFKDVLYELRTERGLSQRDLAEKLHRSTGTIGMWENGTRLPSREAQEQIADFFNVTLDFLSGRDSKSVYYLDPKTAELAQEIFENKELHGLMDAGRDLKPENLQFFTDMIKKFKEGNPDG